MQVGWSAGIGRQASDCAKLRGLNREATTFALKGQESQVQYAFQIEDATVNNQIIEQRVVDITVVLRLQIVRAVTVLLLNSCAGAGFIQPLTLHDVADALLKRGNDAHVQYIAPLCQDHLPGASYDDYIARVRCCLDDSLQCIMINLFLRSR